MSALNKSASEAVPSQDVPTHGSGPIDGTVSPSKAAAPTAELAAGSTLGPYRIEKKLGEGGMGAVYKATHEHLEKSFAVKVLSAAVTANPDAVARFRREMKAVGKVDHPHIVRATDAGEANGIQYLAMEFVDGTDLQQLVRARGPLSVANACKATRQAAMALMAAHGAGLVHRDVKPSNLLLALAAGHELSGEGQADDEDELPLSLSPRHSAFHIKLLDLGLARLSLDPTQTTELTAENQTFGTPDYMAPEQWQDAHNADARADLYSLGCTLFYLLAGRAPFGTEQCKTLTSKMTAHITGTMPDLSAIRSDVPPEVCAIFQKLTAKNPRDRYQSAADVVTALTPFTKSSPVAPRQESRTLENPSLSATTPIAPPTSLAPTASMPVRQSSRGARRLLWLAAFAAIVLAGIIIKITHKDGSVTQIKVPDGAKIEITTDDSASETSNPKSEISNLKSQLSGYKSKRVN